MSKLKELIQSPHIQVALATGVSIVAMAYVSKRVLSDPMASVPLAVPPFLMLLFELMWGRYKDTRLCATSYWITAILLSTIFIIGYYLIKSG